MPYAIRTRGVGNPVSYRYIKPGGQLFSYESFVVANEPPAGSVLASDLVSLRLKTEADILVESKEYQRNVINRSREIAIVAPVTFNGVEYDADERSRNNLVASVAFIRAATDAGLPVPQTIPWRDAANVDHDLALAELIGLAAVMFAQVQAAYEKSWLLKDRIANARSDGEVRAILW